MIRPTIHLNGTARADLLKQLEDSHRAIENALEALSRAAPHGRDYYPQGADALTAALTEHRSRVERIVSVKEEIEVLWEQVTDS